VHLPPPTTYKFETLDKVWMATVESGQLALTCRNYVQWSDFRSRLADLVSAFVPLYQVSAVTRLGVRFQDVIRKAELGLEGCSWRDLIRPEVLATWHFFTDGLDENPPTNFGLQLAIPPGEVRIGISTVRSEASDVGLLIDTDCYANEVMGADPAALLGRADDLHEYTSLVFQACITDVLHDALRRD
jgi:uncharacterized protein (TIGR04255 family)